MPQNKNALIRYKTIDKCLQNYNRKWTLEDLIEACSEALYEFEGRKNPVSKRTIQMDIQLMRSEKLGYNAPIEVYDKKYYRYQENDFSITDIPLTETDINVLTETVAMLKQFKDFSLFQDVTHILQRLEDKIYAEKTQSNPVILLDKNEKLKGLHHLDTLYQAIVKKIVLKISYKSFKAKTITTFIFHPFVLKEFNNRWFIIGEKENQKGILNLALDRIEAIDFEFSLPNSDTQFDAENHFKHVIGVTVNQGMQPRSILIHVDANHAPYILTKPFHHSQKCLKTNEDGSIIIQLYLKINNEFERLLLGFADGIEIISPKSLRIKTKEKLTKALQAYHLKEQNQ